MLSEKTLYTARRMRGNGKLYGSFHGSVEGEATVCGEKLDSNWSITDNVFEGVITCKECLEIMAVTTYDKLPGGDSNKKPDYACVEDAVLKKGQMKFSRGFEITLKHKKKFEKLTLTI